LAALAIAIHLAESVLPSPLPGIKPGLANIVTLLAFTLYGWRCAAWVSLIRVLAAALVSGTFLGPTFALSLAGALGSLAALGLASRIPGIGYVGLSLCSAQAHMLGQFAVAYWLFFPHPAVLKLLPMLLTASLLFGLISGLIAQGIASHLTALKTDPPS
jgi:heptaprenyl diphosphate synthase